ncbi:PolC-type DNA polymerase III, partial [Christensenellaceae bacterium OttesenSCG-928-L17]|nr:PolC-type DNA polymerase III [Christensenellaceae bacterium OttesenSCG-928-L17]
ALAITDHGVVQAFPDAAKAGKENGVKILYGVEGYLLNDTEPIPMEQTYVVFDVETTGLKAEQGYIIEIGAVKLKGGKIVDRLSTFVHPGAPIPPNITKLTGIENHMVEDAPLAGEVLAELRAFCEGCVLVAHNAPFDTGFIRVHGARHGIAFDMPYVDTLTLSRYLFFGLASHRLDALCSHLNIPLENHHRAVNDAEATAELFLHMLARIQEKGLSTVPAITARIENSPREKGGKQKTNHIILLARTQEGMRNLYRLVSHAHMDFFHSRPQIPKYLLELYREGLLLGSACEQGEVYRALLRGAPEEELQKLAAWYDYIEIQPVQNNAFLVRNKTVASEDALRALNRRLVDTARACKKPVVATCDVHFLNPEDSVFRAIIMSEQGYEDALEQAPLYYKTTGEMLEEFAYLGEETAREVVICAPNAIADLCGELKPYPDGTHAPQIENADTKLRELASGRAHELYGEVLPPIVQARLDKELKSIIGNGFASLYMMAQMLVQKSLSDGYLVGSRGSVGSSFVATMAGITEVNPLAPHYLCPKCKHCDFEVDRSRYATGVDLPAANCPHCNTPYHREGFDIPFEVFLGFHGDKTPDIDLNFSSEYQPVAHKFTEEMVGEGYAFRAGTISGVQEKTAYGYVKNYLEKVDRIATKQEIDRLCKGCQDVKRTTGQHPGGIVVLPRGKDIFEFTPLQYPADQKQKKTITTHFDFHALDDRLVKLDILGHDDPTALRMMQDLTDVDPRGIPLNDPDTLSLYKSAEKMEIDLSALNCDVGSIGLPEFGTGFVRQILMD